MGTDQAVMVRVQTRAFVFSQKSLYKSVVLEGVLS